jgi:hypothetical protein
MTTALEQKALNNIFKGLQSLGCSYVIIDKDGADYTYGEAFKKGRKKKGKHPHGAIRDHYWPLLQDLAPGNATEIPAGQFSIDDIQSGVAAKASTTWGPGSFVTSRNKEKNVLEVLRVF